MSSLANRAGMLDRNNGYRKGGLGGVYEWGKKEGGGFNEEISRKGEWE